MSNLIDNSYNNYRRKSYKKHKIKRNKSQKKYQIETKKERQKTRKKWWLKIRSSNVAYNTGIQYRLLLIAILGGKCVKCGNTNFRVLQVDHKNGKGNKDRNKFHSSTTLYKWYIDHPGTANKELQPLCANCNMIKLEENNERWLN